MKFRFRSVYVLLSVITCVTSQQGNHLNASNQIDRPPRCSSTNCTNPDNLPKPPAAGIPVGPPPFWCPDGYKLLYAKDGKWLHACRPHSCPGTKKNNTGSCIKIENALKTCPKIYLTEDQYKIDDTDSLVDSLHNTSVKLGFYVIEFTRAIICDPKGNDTSIEPSNRPELPRWCMPMVVDKGGYSNTAGRLFIHSINRHVDLFTVELNETANVCPYIDPMITDKCGANKGLLKGDEFELLPDWGLSHTKNILNSKVYPHGEYVLAVDKSYAIICIVPAEPISKTILYVYGVASLLSAFCLFLALVVHLFYPVVNYHAKSMLCLAFSFLVMYVAMTVRFFSDNFESQVTNLVLFAVQYISSLGAFFWLSILSFDIWRVFAKLRGTINTRDTALKKGIFFAKCAYAWGIPTVLCAVAIALTYSPNVQKSLSLDLQLQSTSWLHDTTTMLIMFYTPIMIVLLENVLFFILTIVNLRKASRGTEMLNGKVSKKLFRVYLKLFLVMGLCWFFEVISWLTKYKTGKEVWYFTDVINCLQGVLIFMIYVFKKKTLMIIKKKMGYINTSQMNTTTSSTQEGAVKMEAVSIQKNANK